MALSPERREGRRRHLVTIAQALIRERGDAGFSMAQLAARAGVSPATPYNLLGSKPEILRLVVREEFDSFVAKLAERPPTSPLERLLDATAVVVAHYEADRPFYRGLYRALGEGGGELSVQMSAEGRALWRELVLGAVESGELLAAVSSGPFTDVLLRTLASTTQAWLAGDWSEARFGLEIGGAVRLLIAAVARADLRDRLTAEALAAQAGILKDESAELRRVS